MNTWGSGCTGGQTLMSREIRIQYFICACKFRTAYPAANSATWNVFIYVDRQYRKPKSIFIKIKSGSLDTALVVCSNALDDTNGRNF